MLELLSPAGDMRAFEIAINNGADAVYLGLDSFNARMKAQNFDADNIGEVVARAHFYGVKVYVTINTILQNDEFSKLISLVKVAIGAGVDAFLVQDLGVAKVLKDCFENITLHASTQLGVHNLYGAKIAQKMGFSRVVLSRETKLEDIKAIRQNTSLEIEYFVQGALCVAFSGNCYLSSKEQGASGNRGLCKQLCRLPYRAQIAKDVQDGYLLSARDLCLFESVKQLADAGVCSFKIEGRLRREGYVASVVSAYRKAIDNAQNGRATKLDDNTRRLLKSAFSRGEYLERAYLDNGTPSVIEKKCNNHSGVSVGIVKSVKAFKGDLFEAVVFSKHQLKRGDGLKFFEKGKERASVGVGDAKCVGQNLYSFVTKTQIKEGWQVNLILDMASDETLLAKKRYVPIRLDIKAVEGEPLCINATYQNGDVVLCASAKSCEALEKAINAPTSEKDICESCSKTADSGFEVVSASVHTNGVFVAKSVMNATRREVLSALKEKIIAQNFPQKVRMNDDKIREYLSLADKCDEKTSTPVRVVKGDDFSAIILQKGERLLVKPSVYSAEHVKKLLELLDVDEKDVMLDLPILANGRDIARIEEMLSSINIKTLVSNNIYGLYFAEKGYNVIAGQGHNIANVFAVHKASELGASAYVPSCEYPSFESDGTLERIKISEDIPLMTFAHCPYKTLYGNDCANCTYKPSLTLSRERKKYVVRRVRIDGCRFELYAQK